MARSIVGLILLALGAALAAPALAEKRVALVIGNSAYKHAPALANPKNDAEGMAAALKRLNFDVLAGTDLDKPAMERLLQAFAVKLDTADVALVFYAGHGLQVHGRNYLVPVDGKLDRESDLPFQAVPLDLVQGLMEQGQRTNIMILDACRDNPLARNLARTMGTRSTGIGRGLGETKAGIGTLIVYATQPGNVALDGDDGKNSPFTLSLLKHIESPGLEIRQVLTRVRNEVITATRDKQVPWDSSSLRGDFFFVAAPAAREAPAPGPAPVTPAPTVPPADGDIVFWQSIKDSKNAADYRAYLAKYPQGTFAELAKLRLAEIEKAAAVTPAAPTPDKPIPPAPPQRTSTYEDGAWIDNGKYLSTTLTATARLCQAQCLRNPRCVAWSWYKETRPAGPRECYLHAALGPRAKTEYIISGVIRTTPAAAPAPPVAPKPQPGAAPAPGDQQALVREAIRKAEAGEAENGFCGRLNWLKTSFNDLARSRPSGIATYGGDSVFCGVWRGAGESIENGIRVRKATLLLCQRMHRCRVEQVKYCRGKPVPNRPEWIDITGGNWSFSPSDCLQ